MNLIIPTQTGDGRGDVRIDKSRNYRPAGQSYDTGARSGQRAHVAIGADRNEASVSDRDRLPDREIAIDGNDLTTAQHHFGWRFYRQRTREVHFTAAAAAGDRSQQQNDHSKAFQIKPHSFFWTRQILPLTILYCESRG